MSYLETESEIYRSDDYRNLFNLVTHSERRSPYDVVTKHIIAAVLVTSLKGAGYFPTEQKDDSADILIGKLLLDFFSSSIPLRPS